MSKQQIITLEVDFDDRVTDLIHDGYDLAIRGGRIVDSSLISRPVCRMNTILVASPDYLSLHGEPKHPEELKNHKLIARRFLGGRLSPWGFRDNDGSFSTFIPEPAALTLSALEALVKAACMGVGIAQVGVHTALKKLISGELKVVMFERHDPGNYEMVIQYPHRALVAPRVRVTIEYLLEALSKDSCLTFSYGDLARFRY
ncbi:hypothetical protein F6X34_12295 [Dickeya dianthicola]|nr:substrate binding domain-containing protein [Dickeya dianthicola]MZG43663.1 hypothetical protein [Dickeya dianthicola]